jgi:hypothetical protein
VDANDPPKQLELKPKSGKGLQFIILSSEIG